MTAIPATLEALRVPIGSVKPYSSNPRRGSVATIKASLERHGQYRPIVVNRRTGEALAGNHTLQAAGELGWEEIAATFVDVDAETAARIVLIDNRSNDLAGYDDIELAVLLQSLPDVDGTGYEPLDLDKLLASLQEPDGRDTDPGSLPPEPRTRLGDLYVLGEHRLLCGDARDGAGPLLDSGRAALLWTDPPYGVSYVGKTAEALTIAGDDEAGLERLLTDAFARATEALEPGSPVYVAHPPGPLSATFARCFVGAGWRMRQTLVWIKDAMVLGHGDYHYRHEPLLYGYTGGGQGKRGRGHHGWYGDNAQTSVLAFDRPRASREHPTSKPVPLVERCLLNSSPPGGSVLDPFAGSGSTLIAAENLGRRCLASEIDPGYCDVIVDRWERHTGGVAELLERAAA